MRVETAGFVATAIAVVLLAACGGENDAGSSADDTAFAERIEEAAAAIDEQWGARDGFAVVLLAVDRGYTVGQIVERPTIEGDGAIAGLEPAGPATGLIAPSDSASLSAGAEAWSRSSFVAAGGAAAAGPADGYVAFVDQSLGELFTAAQQRRDAAAREAEAAAALEAEVSAIAMGLLARGYSLEQVIEAIVLSSWSPQSLNAPCFFIPGETPGGSDQMGAVGTQGETCPQLSASEAGNGAGAATGQESEAANVAALDGVYLSDQWDAPAGGPVVEVLETDIAVTVADGTVDGGIVWVVVVRSDDGERTTIQHATQTIEFGGAVAPDGTYQGEGRTFSASELISCEPAEECSGVTATTSPPDGVLVTLTGTVVGDTFEAEIVNSVSGATRGFEARRVD